jgi:hypothetical protein
MVVQTINQFGPFFSFNCTVTRAVVGGEVDIQMDEVHDRPHKLVVAIFFDKASAERYMQEFATEIETHAIPGDPYIAMDIEQMHSIRLFNKYFMLRFNVSIQEGYQFCRRMLIDAHNGDDIDME